MYISKFVIRNFKNFKNATFNFTKGVNTIIGENGSGKTNFFQALRILLDSKLPRYSVNLTDQDFSRSIKNWRGHWIVLSITLDELTADESIQCLSFLEAGIPDGSNRGNYNYFFRPEHHIRKELFDLSSANPRDEDEIRDKIESLTHTDYEYVITVGAVNMNFGDDDFYRENVGDFENFNFPNPEIDDISSLGQFNNVLNIYNDVSFTFAEALRDVVSDLKSYRNSPLIALLKAKETKINEEEKDAVKVTIDGLNSTISELGPVKEVSTGILSTINRTVGETYAPLVDIEADLPSDMSTLLRSLVMKVGDGDEPSHKGRIEELSLGGANLIYLSLKLLEYTLELGSEKAAHFLIIEEPEAHIHTHIQKSLFQNVEDENTQIIYSTHSTHISEVSKISSVNILARNGNVSEVFHPSAGLSPLEITKLERYLDAVRTTLLFAKKVILVEGDAELILVPAMVKKVYGISLDELGISLINVGSTGFKNIAQIFCDERVRRKCAIITDLDASIFDLPEDENDDTKELRDARNSQLDGERRKNDLDDFSNTNQWIELFYAPHTFEVELIGIESNEETFCCIYHSLGPPHITPVGPPVDNSHAAALRR